MKLISIIIPVFNRDTLLAYTLDSISKQTYTNWECILVDDGSTDDSFILMQEYQNRDVRFKAFKRPNSIAKGANPCRNYGFTKSSGFYIKWFDSDDIMLPNHLEIACQTLVENQLDFVVTDTLNFDHDTNEFLGKPYDFDKNKAIFNTESIALNRIGWITNDFLGVRRIVSNVKFNEYITDGDEYNFFIKVFQQDLKGVFIDKITTHRRIHNDSISVKNRINDIHYLFILSNIKFQTANDLIVFDNKDLIRWFLSGYMQISFDLALISEEASYKNEAFKLICKYFSIIKGLAFLIALVGAKYFNKGYYIMRYARE